MITAEAIDRHYAAGAPQTRHGRLDHGGLNPPIIVVKIVDDVIRRIMR
ncbi:hypothetical protein DSCO28_31940 [Desulfosarcina ovata subsp. sediminis]|uniref:Uncharacterized protein n=2 Tax=Desulfosarcina ovata TaxID=83564 RepID=A0A5K8AI97_9BACT|nr:hypothetical protein DSCO28_31940 [Desulfosarcina ovata subsp. sediminis]BBO92403.1 hypothetical protein DSCOOX_55830 [Desulfosarcina ovata subsp. ovata]